VEKRGVVGYNCEGKKEGAIKKRIPKGRRNAGVSSPMRAVERVRIGEGSTLYEKRGKKREGGGAGAKKGTYWSRQSWLRKGGLVKTCKDEREKGGGIPVLLK